MGASWEGLTPGGVSVLWGWTYFGEPHSSACGEVPRAVPACSTLMELTLT